MTAGRPPKLTPEQFNIARRRLKAGEPTKEIALDFGITPVTLRRALNGETKTLHETPELVYPELPSSELPAAQLIEQACSRFTTYLQARNAQRWFEIKVRSDRPIGVCFVGDPHVDSNGCNWPLLKEHISILSSTKRMYGVGIGDLTDNWTGRLIRLYADSEMNKKQAWKLAAYLLKGADIKWLCHLLGNHDQWGDGEHLIKANATPCVPVCDWAARFKLVFPNGSDVRVHAAHNFPGSSIWNKMHGPQKASMLWERADIFVCGHTHEWQIVEQENANRDFICWLLRSRGYKFIDSYANNLGYAPQRYGASITAIIDPAANGPTRVRCFPDVGEAAEFLTWKQSRAT